MKLKTRISLTTNTVNLRKVAFCALLLPLLISSCSTKKNTFSRRAYHNLTAHYNAYWNGNESLKEGVSDLRKNAKDNYASILFVNNYGTQSNAQSLNPQMDRAIEKASKVIQRHSMFFDKKEQVKWVIRSYVLIGKANFYKQDYNAARRAFEYVSRQYPYDPAQYEARLWLGRTYCQQKQYERAITVLDELSAESAKTLLPWTVRKELPLVYADMYIAQGKLNLAREQIEKALPLNSNAKLKTRLNYILAQIYQKEGKNNRANENFTKVLKSPASFEMAFNARINLARVYNANTGDRRMIVRELEKMLKDMKNKDFQDQIYYALADIAQKDKNDTLAIRHLRKSVATSLSNDYQKSISSLKLADLYYSRNEYKNAHAYYDTTLMVLPSDFPNFREIESRTEILTRLVDNLQVVHVQDSLQHLASLPEAERLKVIDKAIAEYTKKEEEKRRREEAERLQQMAGGSLQTRQIVDPMRGTSALGGGGWYFYNPTAISMGFSEFTRKWGRRKLEDNWRLSNKREVMGDMFDDEGGAIAKADSTTDGKGGSQEKQDFKNRETYLKNLPFTPESIDASNQKIAVALFNAGIIYLEELSDKKKAGEIFEKLNNRFPENEASLQTNYHLYRINRDLNNEAEMNRYKESIIRNHPDSDYAKILIDPNYNLELEAIRERVRSLYEETFLAFNRGQYRTAIIYSNDALANYSNQELSPKFAFIRAVSLGKTENQDTMKVELNKLIAEYPNSDVVDYARRLLGEGKQGTSATRPGETVSTGDEKSVKQADFSMYKYNPKATHFYALIVDGTSVNVYGTKVRISDFNIKNYSVESLQVNSVLLDNSRQMITISSFNDLEKAFRYYNGIKNDEYVFSGFKDAEYEQFLISAENYPIFFKEKNTEAYKQFFEKNYLKK